MEAILDAVQDIIAAEPAAETPPVSVQPDDNIVETQLAQEISTLWSDHLRLSASRKVTGKELRLLRARLAQMLHQMKSLLARPGRGGEWRGWLRERRIPRSTADRLVARFAETLVSAADGNVPTGAIPEPAAQTAEKLAASVWSSVKKALATSESVVQFLASIAQISGIPHERRQEGLMIFAPVPEPAGELPAPTPAADLVQQLSNDAPTTAEELPASVPAADPVPRPSNDAPAATEEPATEAAAAPPADGQAAAVADAGSGTAA